MRAWVVLVAMSACVQPGEVVCNDGRVCPETYTCTITGCASPEQLTACDGVADDERCTTQTGPGRCLDGACIVAFCGNGKIEPGEACDDGNQLGDDGCSGTCTSDESCGNGVVELAEECDCGDAERPGSADRCTDGATATFNGGALCSTLCVIRRCGDGAPDPGETCDDGNSIGGDGCSFDCLSSEECGNDTLDFFAGEQCDDGNLRNLDGCSATCNVERVSWQTVVAEAPPPMTLMSAAFDTARNRWVVFGGLKSPAGENADTWELEGSQWTRRQLGASPSVRQSAAMAYDVARGRIVLFGGISGSNLDPATWEYDGVTWREFQTITAPSVREKHRIVYDSKRKRVVMFGGLVPGIMGPAPSDETWEYDGTNWTLIAAPMRPEARSSFGMAYDPKRGRVVLFGGVSETDSFLDDTWEFDGTTWTERTIVGPLDRRDHSLAFDPARGQVVLLGGDETWTLDSSGWTQLAGANPSGTGQVSDYDPSRGRVITFGGRNSGNNPTEASYELIGSTWTLVDYGFVVNRGGGITVAFDTRRGTLVLFGGAVGETGNDQTRTLGEHEWRFLDPAAKPSARAAGAMAYDPDRDVMVLFGGETESGVRLADTWEWNGTNWLPRSPTASPPARSRHAMVYDPVRKRVVLFGGSGSQELDDTWEYTGTTWIPISMATKPSPRAAFGMTYDASRSRVVMYGASFANPDFDTWTYDGTQWTKLVTQGQPPWRGFTSIAYDAGRDRIVMHGGGASNNPRTDTWELDGTVWTEHKRSPTDLANPPSTWHTLVYDPTRGRVLLVGGVRLSPTPFVYEYRVLPTAAGEVCRAGRDLDGDTNVGCDDDECWGLCSPNCAPDAPAATCPTMPRCGDGTCSALESCRICPADCGLGGVSCPVRCGDGFCDGGESVASCPGDC